MLLLSFIWISLGVLLLIIVPCDRTFVTALSCYECNSYKDASCSGNSLGKFKKTCDVGAAGCRKMHYMLKTSVTAPTVDRVIRQCAKTKMETRCVQYYGSNGKRYKQYICECSGDFCNASTRPTSQSSFVYMVSVATVVALYLL